MAPSDAPVFCAMLFHSLEFLFLFLPVTLASVWLARRYGGLMPGLLVLTLASLVFYGWWDVRYLGLIIASIGGNFLVGALVAPSVHRGQRQRRIILIIAIIANLAVLGYYKYWNFFLDNLNWLFGTGFDAGKIILPLAISFFTFQQIGFLVDRYRGRIKDNQLLPYGLFVTFFPQLIAGPIVRHREMMPQFLSADRRWFTWNNWAIGLMLISVGLVKKTIIAGWLASRVSPVYLSAEWGHSLSAADAWFATTGFMLQIYFDFSAYSDIAIGLALLVGIRLPYNFLSPLKATSIAELWRRWHITLGRFVRDYVTLPLARRYRSDAGLYLTLFLSMVLVGFWHGASWSFVAFGALHGVIIMINRGWAAFKKARGIDPVGGRFRIAAAQSGVLFVMIISAVLFNAESWSAVEIFFTAMAGQSAGGSETHVTWSAAAGVLVLMLFVLWAPNIYDLFEDKFPDQPVKPLPSSMGLTLFQTRRSLRALPLIAMVAALFALLALFWIGGADDYIYFQF